MKFNKSSLQELAWDEEPEGFKIIEKEIVDTSRWSIHEQQIFSFDGKFYVTQYSYGATELQDEMPYHNEPEEIECDEVIPMEVRKTIFVKKGKEESDIARVVQ